MRRVADAAHLYFAATVLIVERGAVLRFITNATAFIVSG